MEALIQTLVACKLDEKEAVECAEKLTAAKFNRPERLASKYMLVVQRHDERGRTDTEFSWSCAWWF